MSESIREEQRNLKSQISEKEDAIKKLIFETCEAKLKNFNQSSQIFGKEETKTSDKKEELPYHIFADDTYHPMPYTVEASTKTLYKRLARFIKLTDYMFVQLKINIIKNSYDNVNLYINLVIGKTKAAR